MLIVSTNMPTSWLRNARREWATNVSAGPSEGGFVEPVALQSRPLLRFTADVNPNYYASMENLFIECNGMEKGFFVKCPLPADHQATAVAIGTGTGASQTLQLMISRGQTWAALYPIDGTITIYSNAVATVQGVDWTLGLLGEITGTFTLGHAITATFQFKTAFRFLENSMTTMLEYNNLQTPQQISFEEIP
jgi:hypothetical protein